MATLPLKEYQRESLDAIGRFCDADTSGQGPRVVYGEACRLGPKSLQDYGITFRQVSFELKVD
ncbi:MAG: hypothetical protein IMZ62_09450 [Chloroflexi bacterium]|nr:hypothetical protein [Chloroflexota bacterium]